MTIDIIRTKADAFDRRSRRQDLGSIAVFAFLIMANAATAAFQSSMTEKIGDLLTVAAALYCLTSYLRVREPSPAALGETPTIDFYRDKILRRQAMVKRFWIVALLFLPGMLLSTVGDAFVSPRPLRVYVILAAGFAGLVVVCEWLNRREARRLSDEYSAAGFGDLP
jgi:hypothetical protein